MTMLLLEDKIAKIVSKLEVAPHFGGYLDEEDYDNALNDCFCAVYASNSDAEVYHGVTKMVIVPKDNNKVIKIPFLGYWYYQCGDWDEKNQCYTEGNSEWEPFTCCDPEGGNPDNYCEHETTLYNIAVENGFGQFFLDTKFYGFIPVYNSNLQHPIYIQEKAIEYEDYIYKNKEKKEPSDDSRKLARTLFSREICPETWIAIAIDKYGKELVEKFFKFLDEYDMSGDLHSGNVGFTKDGNPVLLDWAGWREDC